MPVEWFTALELRQLQRAASDYPESPEWFVVDRLLQMLAIREQQVAELRARVVALESCRQ